MKNIISVIQLTERKFVVIDNEIGMNNVKYTSLESRMISVGLGLLLMALGAYFGQVRAAEWVADPSVKMSAIYNDNILLRATNTESSAGLFVQPKLGLSRKTEISEVSIKGDLDTRRYSSNTQNDSDNARISLSSFYKTELSKWAVTATVEQYSVIASEEEDTGLLFSNRDRDLYSLSPSWTYSLAADQKIQLTYSFTELDYDGNVASLRDYRYQNVSGAWIWSMNERDKLTLLLNAYDYETLDSLTSVKTDGTGLRGGIDHNFTETMAGSLHVGLSSSTNNIGGVKRGTDNPYILAELSNKTELSKYSIRLKTSLSPSGAGQVNQSDRLDFRLSHRWSEKATPYLNISGIRNKINSGASITDRKYYNVQPGLSWKLTKQWDLSGSYRYVRQKYDSASGTADSSQFFISLIYKWLPRSVSR